MLKFTQFFDMKRSEMVTRAAAEEVETVRCAGRASCIHHFAPNNLLGDTIDY
jgi:hypothetical protein